MRAKRPKKTRKAQSLVFEQVLLFSMGVVIFIVCFAAFSVYQSYFSQVSTNDQMNQVSDIIVSEIIKLTQKEYAVNSTIELNIPARIGDRAYIVELSNEELDITIPEPNGITKTTTIFNLGAYQFDGVTPVSFSGRVTSTSESILIYKKEKEIILM
jgi:hypothetical protein